MNEHTESKWLVGEETGVTGIDFLDQYLPHSQPANLVYGLLGPIGVGKSTLGAMIAVEGAKKEYARRLAGSTSGTWVIVNFDGSETDVLERIVSHGAKISRSQRYRRSIQENLSRIWANHLYELKRKEELPQAKGILFGETERLRYFTAHLWNQELHLLHLASEGISRAEPLVQTISGHIERLVQHRRIAGVVIDYVGMAVREYVGHDSPYWELSHEICSFVSDSREQIAERWDCPVWLVHQLNGAANQNRPGIVQHHNDASECRRFGEGLDACFTLGTRDSQTAAFQIACTKSPTEPPGPTILQFDPDFATLRKAENLRVKRTTGMIVNTNSPIYIDPSLLEFLES